MIHQPIKSFFGKSWQPTISRRTIEFAQSKLISLFFLKKNFNCWPSIRERWKRAYVAFEFAQFPCMQFWIHHLSRRSSIVTFSNKQTTLVRINTNERTHWISNLNKLWIGTIHQEYSSIDIRRIIDLWNVIQPHCRCKLLFQSHIISWLSRV